MHFGIAKKLHHFFHTHMAFYQREKRKRYLKNTTKITQKQHKSRILRLTAKVELTLAQRYSEAPRLSRRFGAFFSFLSLSLSLSLSYRHHCGWDART